MESPRGRGLLASPYLAALIAPAVIAGVMQVTWPFFLDTPVSPYFLAVIFCAWYGGLGPGLLSLVISLLLTDFFFIEPYFRFWFPKQTNVVRLLLFAVAGPFICVMSELMHRERRRAKINLEAAKRAERSLSEKKRFANQIAELSPVVISVFDLATRRDVYTSPDVANLIGYTPKEIAEMEDPFTLLWHPEDIPRANQNLALLKHAKDGEITEFEYRIRHRDGECRWVASRIIPFERDEHGAVRQIVTASLDITERKQAEDALRRSEDRTRLIIDTIPTMAWSLRPDAVLDFVNQRWLDYTGLSFEEAIEEPTRTVHPEDLPGAMEKWLPVKATSEAYEDEMRLQRADGEYRWFLVRIAPLRDEQGNLLKRYGVAIDIEERKQAEEKLKATSEQLRALSASLQSAREEEATRIAREIHDELGAALSSLRWDLEDVVETISKSEDRSQLQELRKKVETMTKLIDNTINTVRRIASELRPSVLDDLGLVVAIKWQAQQFQNRTGIIVHCDCPLDNVDLNEAQSTAVFRIFQEALTNILRHARATRVNIQMNEEGGQLILTINDNGRGVTADEKSRSQSLGLLGMQERAHLIGGNVKIIGFDGKGTVVNVRIPISRQKEYSKASL